MNSSFCLAVHALVYLHHRGELVSSEELARNICTNPARVRKVLARMKKDGLVETKEGSSGGGYRFAKGAGEVSLAQVARAHSQDMIDRNFFDHINPDGDDPSDRVSAARDPLGAGWRRTSPPGSAPRSRWWTAWMNSPGHRANILNADFTSIGVGYTKAAREHLTGLSCFSADPTGN